jgi:hypothetical protein
LKMDGWIKSYHRSTVFVCLTGNCIPNRFFTGTNNSGKKKSPNALAGSATSSVISTNNSGKKKSPNVIAGTAVSSASQPSASFPVGPCLLGKHCFAPTHELRKKCPGCGNNIHVLCGCVLKQMEGSNINGKMKWCRFGNVPGQ